MPTIKTTGASLYCARTDRDGETRITFCIPKTEQVKAALISALVERSLTLEVTVEENQSVLAKGRFVDGEADG